MSRDHLQSGGSHPDRGPILSEYLAAAMKDAAYEELGDGSIAGEIPSCAGVLAFASSRKECESDLRSVLEGWVLLGLLLGHRLPVIQGIDINRSRSLETALVS